MSEERKQRLKIWLPLLFSVVLIAGMVIGFKLRDSLRNKRNITAIIQRSDRLEEIIDLIKDRYVDSVDANLLYADAVDGILSHLDPHTVYIAADERGEMDEKLSGRFYGIGVSFIVINDTMLITSVVDGGPASIAGITKGDRVIQVGDSIIVGNKTLSGTIPQLLKGPKGTEVSVVAKKGNTNKLDTVLITRGLIPIVSVDASIMLDSVTGFIKLNRFSDSTYKDFSNALSKLKRHGMQRLVLDLRQNPGGYLDEAVKMIDDFIEGEKLLVYTKGNRSVYTEYNTGERKKFERGRVIILVDEGSASASEIFAGAIQDYDRGVIMGRRTYGKGLVQEQYSLEDGAALRLTIAKYYIPSGRSIQRSFEDGKEAYRHDILERYESGELTGNNNIAIADTTKYYTTNGRVVYGGGGITPDIYVPYDTTNIPTALIEMLYSTTMRNMLWQYYFEHTKELRQYKNAASFNKSFDAAVLLAYYAKKAEPETSRYIKKQMKRQGVKDYFLLHMKAQMARVLFDNEGYYNVINSDDIMLQKALEVIHTSRYDSVISR